MMVPDYSLIAEIKLFSFGFSDARNLARKLTQVLLLGSPLPPSLPASLPVFPCVPPSLHHQHAHSARRRP